MVEQLCFIWCWITYQDPQKPRKVYQWNFSWCQMCNWYDFVCVVCMCVCVCVACICLCVCVCVWTDLRWNNIGLLGGRAFIEMLKANKILSRLELAGNNVPTDIAKAIGLLVHHSTSLSLSDVSLQCQWMNYFFSQEEWSPYSLRENCHNVNFHWKKRSKVDSGLLMTLDGRGCWVGLTQLGGLVMRV